jgi:hypothetical protein
LADLPDEEKPPSPDLDDWLIWVWRAWHRLHDERPYTVTGFGAPMGGMMIKSAPGRITWSSIRNWCEHHHYSGEDAMFLERCLAAMDDEYLLWWGAQQQRGRR